MGEKRLVGVRKHKKSRRMPYIPSELKKTICNSLSEKDLASVRLVSKAFEQVATPLLFRSVWFSTDCRDWHYLKHITRYPDIRNYVREIRYDNTVYEKKLYSRKIQVEALGTSCSKMDTADDHWIEGPYVEYSKASVLRGYKEYQRLYNSQMDLEGDRFYREKLLTKHIDEISSSTPNDFVGADGALIEKRLARELPWDLVCLIQILMLMPNVDTFSLSNARWYGCGHYWTSIQTSLSTASERSFSIQPGYSHENKPEIEFDPVPRQATEEGLYGPQRGFQILIQAAFISKMKNLRYFNLGPEVRHSYGTRLTFLDFEMLSTELQMARHAFGGLKDLNLRFAGHGYGASQLSHEERAALQSGKVGQIFHHATGLTDFALEFGNLSRIDDLSWILGPGAWHSLRCLTLRFMDVHASQLATFLLLHSSSLQYLCLEDLMFREEDLPNLTIGHFRHGPGSWSQFFQAITALDLGELSLARLGKNFTDLECSIWHSKDRADIQSFLHSGGSILFATAGMGVVTDEEEEDEVEEVEEEDDEEGDDEEGDDEEGDDEEGDDEEGDDEEGDDAVEDEQ